jgi:GNAT superfamily N-acetyltransferase
MQRLGIGTALLESLEAEARQWGLSSIELGSSSAARTFYERHGYVASGSPVPGFGISHCFPYRKALGAMREGESEPTVP